MKTINTGIYSVPEASRLTGVSTWRIRRWLRGYDFQSLSGVRHSGEVWRGQLQPLDNHMAVGFLDLLEIRFVESFLRAGVSWKTMRAAHQAARVELQGDHPFCSNKFATDGCRILLKQAKDLKDEALLDIVSKQREFSKIVEPFLKELEFSEEDMLLRWWPMGRQHQVVVDPARNFGQPIVTQSGVPTSVLARSVKANKSVEEVARWFDAQPREVRDAIAFEDRLAA